MISAIITVLILSTVNGFHSKRLRFFPKNFGFGVATSAYQIEGAWNIDGKGPSIWDNFTHRIPSPILDGTNGDIACDSYYKYKEDVKNAAILGVKYYRFSFAWTRIFPNGYTTTINQKGVQYYKNLIQEIINYDMIPMATIYHWDLPQKLYDDGIHWTNPEIVNVTVNYARFLIKTYPQVGRWISINEPFQFCSQGYGSGDLAPGIKSSGILQYKCFYYALKANAAIYRMYKKEFPQYTAPMAPAIDCPWIDPLHETDIGREAANRELQFHCGIFFHPIFNGDWPEVVKTRIAQRSQAANLGGSRLPEFSKEEISYIKGTADYVALNHYYTILASDSKEGPYNETSYEHDVGVIDSYRPSWVLENNGIFSIVPYGARKMVNWIKNSYGNYEIIFTELGMTEDGKSLDDDIRIDFYMDYCCNILAAMYDDNVKVTGIVAWSLMDNFEWSAGYTAHFGLYHVNFTDPNRTRTPKKSVQFFKYLTQTRALNCESPRRKWPGPKYIKQGFRHFRRGNRHHYFN